ncbi:uridine phosphorylase [Novacetimonas maltaceti]|uniref:Uridine phosphorylase n=1 Tax=Novacetimonas maltaceti TaxID=1203393 RepID=A0A2S3W4S2_9PROT|nr:nucleoside phosphorylase [Novacetimonas maltaceti]POF63573.1 uridine phosphorylase [Novacetimonas maltaceti]PYD59846.1 uridine phosphorylase [Novacetimonas maltaceti]
MAENIPEKSAWYIGATPRDVGDVAILIGDPARVERIATHLDDVHRVPVNRGLQTITGTRAGTRITATAFGMGAPIAAVVLEELRALGVHTFVRIGTAMAAGAVQLGDFVLAEAALRREGTSDSYAPPGYPAVSDTTLNAAITDTLHAQSTRRHHTGVFASYDGFYSQMFALPGSRSRVREELLDDIARFGLIAADMETSALLVAGRMLGARTSSLCVATVDPVSQEKLDAGRMAAAEHDLFEAAINALCHPTLKETR